MCCSLEVEKSELLRITLAEVVLDCIIGCTVKSETGFTPETLNYFMSTHNSKVHWYHYG